METEAVPPGQHTAPSWMRFIVGKNPVWTIVRVLFVVVASVVTFKFVLLPIQVTGNSMAPTYRNGQVKFVNKLAYRSRSPERGDIVAVRFYGNQVLILKRIVGLPGEVFQLRRGLVYINGELLDEPYAHGKIPTRDGRSLGNTMPIQLGPDEYMVIGDNRPISEGYQKRKREIIGKVL